jgi:hypothetical protein
MAENKDIIRDSIADLLTDNDININDDIDSQTLTFQRTPSTITNREMMTLEQSRKRAGKVMESLLRVYLTENFISKSEFVQAKSNLDSMTLGNIMYQMEISQRAIDVLMDNIELGDVNPKLFEALGKLQGTFIDLVRTQTNYIANAGNEYEKLGEEKDQTINISTSTAKEISSGYKSSSQKDLMRLIRNISDKDKQ